MQSYLAIMSIPSQSILGVPNIHVGHSRSVSACTCGLHVHNSAKRLRIVVSQVLSFSPGIFSSENVEYWVKTNSTGYLGKFQLNACKTPQLHRFALF